MLANKEDIDKHYSKVIACNKNATKTKNTKSQEIFVMHVINMPSMPYVMLKIRARLDMFKASGNISLLPRKYSLFVFELYLMVSHV